MNATQWSFFVLGVALGAGAGGLVWWFDMRIYRHHLEMSARDSRPVDIGGRLYVLMPAVRHARWRYVMERVSHVAQREQEKVARYADVMSSMDRERGHVGTDEHDMTTRGGPLRGAP